MRYPLPPPLVWSQRREVARPGDGRAQRSAWERWMVALGTPSRLAKPQRWHPSHLCISLLSSCWVNLNPSWPGPTSLAVTWLPQPLRSPLGPLPHPSFCSSRSPSKPGHSCPDTVHFLLPLPGTLFHRCLHSSLTPCFIQVSIPISSHPRVSLACVVFSHFSYI